MASYAAQFQINVKLGFHFDETEAHKGFGIDPDRTAVMVNFPNGVPFELGPKETRVLTGQALFKHFRNVRKIPGLSSGLNGRLKYEDAFGEPQVKQVCYTFLVSDNSASSGMCGTVLQVLQIK